MRDLCELNDKTKNGGREPEDFNCGGFALGTFHWYVPRSYDYGIYGNYEGYSYETFQEMINEVHMAFPHLEEVPSFDKLPKEGKVIGFRVEYLEDEYYDEWGIEVDCEDNCYSELGDFHFILRYDGVWYHKPGGLDICKFRENPNGNYWCDRYNSEIVWFVDPTNRIRMERG